MRFNLKKGLRVLGIAERFDKRDEYSILAGVIMRCDLIIDGLCYTFTRVGGDDSSEKIIRMYKELNRNDVNVILIGGCIISWFNIVDIEKIYNELNIPTVCISYEETSGIESYIRKYFPENEFKIKLYKKLGLREVIYLRTGQRVYVRYFGLKYNDVKNLLNRITIFGSIPEPIRVAKMFANMLYNLWKSSKQIY